MHGLGHLAEELLEVLGDLVLRLGGGLGKGLRVVAELLGGCARLLGAGCGCLLGLRRRGADREECGDLGLEAVELGLAGADDGQEAQLEVVQLAQDRGQFELAVGKLLFEAREARLEAGELLLFGGLPRGCYVLAVSHHAFSLSLVAARELVAAIDSCCRLAASDHAPSLGPEMVALAALQH